MNLQRNIAKSLSTQLADILREQICCGAIACGERIAGERSLSARYKVSRGTVIEALNSLEKEGYICRIPSKGHFVQDLSRRELYQQILLPYPEVGMDLQTLGNNLELWQISNSIRDGLLAESSRCQCEVVFRYFSEQRQEFGGRQDHRIGGAVFIGHQLDKLSRKMRQKGIPCVRVGSNLQEFAAAGEQVVMPDLRRNIQTLIHYIIEQGYDHLVLVNEEDHDIKIDENQQSKIAEVKRFQAQFAGISVLGCRGDGPELKSKLNAELERCTGRVAVLCFYTVMVPVLHQLVQDYNRSHQTKVGLAGYGTGACFINLVPELTYMKIDYQVLGQTALQKLFQNPDMVQSGGQLISGQLIKGKTI